MNLPWGVHPLSYIIGANGCQTGLPDGRWVRAIPEPYFGTLRERFRVAWWVFTGRAYAIKWPEPGEFEAAARPLDAKLKETV